MAGKCNIDVSEIYKLATTCAKLNEAGCGMACDGCQFNVFNYGLPVSDAALIKANAYTDYHNVNEISRKARNELDRQRYSGVIVVAVIIGLIAMMARACGPGAPTQVAPKDEEQVWLLTHPNDPANITRVLKYMRKYGVPDMNYDGLVNCIDNSLMFRQLYGNSARIMICVNRKMDMNHMFIRIWAPNGLEVIDVEPQGDPFRYSMGAVWGVRYDPMFVTDVTMEWGGYARSN
jgi:hypothetical protein